ncbi:MAG: cytochrome c biogenesis protein CcdA [Microbacteriaceae bacterium]|nr:cytochrome c biogenesis protein CcdA [Microbacteriaceae bacterium]
MDPVGGTILNGGLLVALPLALLAGLVSFASPCVLPLVPGYLGYVSGFASGEKAGRGRLVLGVSLFVLGFTVVFVAFGVLFGTAGLLLRPWLDLITRVAGAVIIVMGLVFIGLFGLMQRTVKPRVKVATGLVGAPLLGIVFALGWTPCLGPTLVAVNAIVLDQGDPWRGGLLAAVYAIGLGVPFLLIALGLGWAASSVRWIKRHIRAINIVGGVLLIVIGVLMVSGLWQALMSRLTAVINVFVPAL